jgi:hypothetical protein
MMLNEKMKIGDRSGVCLSSLAFQVTVVIMLRTEIPAGNSSALQTDQLILSSLYQFIKIAGDESSIKPLAHFLTDERIVH